MQPPLSGVASSQSGGLHIGPSLLAAELRVVPTLQWVLVPTGEQCVFPRGARMQRRSVGSRHAGPAQVDQQERIYVTVGREPVPVMARIGPPFRVPWAIQRRTNANRSIDIDCINVNRIGQTHRAPKLVPIGAVGPLIHILVVPPLSSGGVRTQRHIAERDLVVVI